MPFPQQPPYLWYTPEAACLSISPPGEQSTSHHHQQTRLVNKSFFLYFRKDFKNIWETYFSYKIFLLFAKFLRNFVCEIVFVPITINKLQNLKSTMIFIFKTAGWPRSAGLGYRDSPAINPSVKRLYSGGQSWSHATIIATIWQIQNGRLTTHSTAGGTEIAVAIPELGTRDNYCDNLTPV